MTVPGKVPPKPSIHGPERKPYDTIWCAENPRTASGMIHTLYEKVVRLEAELIQRHHKCACKCGGKCHE